MRVNRSSVVLRDAVPADAAGLVSLWEGVLRRGEREDQLQDLTGIIAATATDPDSRLVVAEQDGVMAGAVYLRVATATPINLEPIVQAVSPHVLPEFRRHGVGLALMEAATEFAEERGIGHVASASLSSSRDANRFLARLGLGPQAVLRAAPTATLRSRLVSRRPALARPRGRQLGQVLAARRSQRRRESDPGQTSTVSDGTG
jgi:GNAT superfamily N-acetyltransferase